MKIEIILNPVKIDKIKYKDNVWSLSLNTINLLHMFWFKSW